MTYEDRSEAAKAGRRRAPASSGFGGIGALASVVALLAAGCGDGALGPGGDGGGSETRFSEEISFPAFEDELSTDRARVEIKLIPGTLVAREVEIEEPEDRADREEIESRVTAIDGAAGFLTLALGNLRVDFGAGTEFRREDDGALTLDEFVAEVEAALAAGRNPPIEAKRTPPAQPQAPDDPTFFATRLELDDEREEPEIEINVDADNLVANASPPPDGFLRVLGLEIEIRAAEGTTELERERDDDAREDAEFEGVVASVDVAGGTVTLTNGTVVRVVDATEIEDEDGDDEELGSLEEVQTALASGLVVEADGEGRVESRAPLTIVAKEVEFEIEDDADDIPDDAEFEALVASVDVAGGIVTLADGTIVRIVAHTEIEDDGDDENLGSLEEVRTALDQGLAVEADGEGFLEATQPRTIVASEIEFELDDDSDDDSDDS